MESPHEMWLTKYHKQLDLALQELANREPALSFLVRDAVAHGRKIRSVLALNLLSWKGWSVPRDQEQAMFDDLARVELLHSASCIIDDIIDGDSIRRGLPSFHVRNGLPQALLASLLMTVLSVRRLYSRHDELIPRDIFRMVQETIVGEAWDSFLVTSATEYPIDLIGRYLQKSTPSFRTTHVIVAHYARRNSAEVMDTAVYGELWGSLYQTANDYYDTFKIPAEVRGKSEEDVLVTLSVPMCFLLEQDFSAKTLLGRRMRRDDLLQLQKRLLAHDIENQTRAYLDEIKSRIRAAYPDAPFSKQCELAMEMVDSLHFWSYKYK